MESWEPSHHLLIYTGKPRKTCVEVAGRRTFHSFLLFLLLCFFRFFFPFLYSSSLPFASLFNLLVLFHTVTASVVTRLVTFRNMEAAASSETPATKYNTTRCHMVPRLFFCLINNHAPDDVMGVEEVQIHTLPALNVGKSAASRPSQFTTAERQ